MNVAHRLVDMRIKNNNYVIYCGYLYELFSFLIRKKSCLKLVYTYIVEYAFKLYYTMRHRTNVGTFKRYIRDARHNM